MKETVYEVDLREKGGLILTMDITALDGEREIDIPYQIAGPGVVSFLKGVDGKEDILRVADPRDAFEAFCEYVTRLTEYGDDDGEDDEDCKYVEGTFLAGGKYFEIDLRYDESYDFGVFGRAAVIDALAAIIEEAIKDDPEGVKTFTTWQDAINKELQSEH